MRVKLHSLGIVTGCLMLAILFVCGGHYSAWASGNRDLISIYADGVQRTVATDAKTVGEALQRANIKLSKGDRSEPSVDSEITSDNFNINIYRAQPVMIVDGTTIKTTVSSYKTPRQIVEHAGFELDPADRVDQASVQDLLKYDFAGLVVSIRRAKSVTIDLYGTLAQVHTAANTVADLLKERGIVLADQDKLSVKLDAPITSGMIIDISRAGQHLVTVAEPITFTETQIQDVNRPIGYQSIKTPGKDGIRLVVYQDMVDGKKVAKKKIQSLIKTQPVQQVVVVGAKVTPTPEANFTGDLSAAFARLRVCEAGGNYANKNNPLYRGAYQFGYGTWNNYGGYYDPADAPPQVQDQKALITYQARGWSPWPVCGAGL